MNHKELRKLIKELSNSEYRRGFVEGHAKDTIAFQIRQLRKARGWEQRDLAKAAFGDAKLQPMVSRYENPDYGRYSITTLLELAEALDVALVVRFAPFSELVEWDLSATPQTLAPASYSQDARLHELAERAFATRIAQVGHFACMSAPAPPTFQEGAGLLPIQQETAQAREVQPKTFRSGLAGIGGSAA